MKCKSNVHILGQFWSVLVLTGSLSKRRWKGLVELVLVFLHAFTALVVVY